jgi:hypothetical protein
VYESIVDQIRQTSSSAIPIADPYKGEVGTLILFKR